MQWLHWKNLKAALYQLPPHLAFVSPTGLCPNITLQYSQEQQTQFYGLASKIFILLLKRPTCQQSRALHLICWCGRSSILPIDGEPVNNSLFCLDVAGNMTQRQKVGQDSECKAETRQTEQRDAGYSEQSEGSLAQSTATIQHYNSPGLTHRKPFWQTSIQWEGGPGWLADLWVRGQCWHDSMWVCETEQQMKCYSLYTNSVVRLIFVQPAAEPNKDATVGSVSQSVHNFGLYFYPEFGT